MRSLALVLCLVAGPALATGIDIEIAGENGGTVHVDLFEDVAPDHVERITTLANRGAYDGVAFHRVIDGFMAQTGDVQFGRAEGGDLENAGLGGSDLPDLEGEFSDLPFERGTVGMARSLDPNSANSQFFIMFEPAPHLNGSYTIVGEVTDGMEIVDALTRGDPQSGKVTEDVDRMESVAVTE